MRKPRVFIMLFLIMFSLFFMCGGAYAGFDIAAKSAILIEASSGQVLFEKNAETPVPPASITKLMTLTLAFEALEKGKVKWDDTVTVSQAAWEMSGSQMFLNIGQEVKFGDLVTGISVVSANDGCVAVAEHLYGSENQFVQAMNDKAKELGLTNTHFMNPTGLPQEGHRMSAKDIAVLARYLITKYPQVLNIESQKKMVFNNITQYNRNPLLGHFQGADGLKTGWTDEAGYCLVGTAKQNDTRLISVALNTKDEKERDAVSRELLNYGFRNFQTVVAANAGDVVGQANIRDGKKLTVPVKPEKQITVVIPFGRNANELKKTVVSTSKLTAPVAAGASAGELEIQLDGKTLTKAKVVAANEVPKANWFVRLWRALLRLIWPGYKG